MIASGKVGMARKRKEELGTPPAHKNKILFLFPFFGDRFFVLFLSNYESSGKDVEFFHREKNLEREKETKREMAKVAGQVKREIARALGLLQNSLFCYPGKHTRKSPVFRKCSKEGRDNWKCSCAINIALLRGLAKAVKQRIKFRPREIHGDV